MTATATTPKRKCFYCERLIGLNGRTNMLSFHKFPATQQPPSQWIVAGERCPGTGGTGSGGLNPVADPQSWDDVHFGDVITVHPLGHRRSFKMRVRSVDTYDRVNHVGFGSVTGQRLTMTGAPSRRRQNRTRVERGERQELIYFPDITLIERIAS